MIVLSTQLSQTHDSTHESFKNGQIWWKEVFLSGWMNEWWYCPGEYLTQGKSHWVRALPTELLNLVMCLDRSSHTWAEFLRFHIHGLFFWFLTQWRRNVGNNSGKMKWWYISMHVFYQGQGLTHRKLWINSPACPELHSVTPTGSQRPLLVTTVKGK